LRALEQLNVRIYADGADKTSIVEMYGKPYIKGFTTNPTLMRKAGVADFCAFAQDILNVIHDRPFSFEVFSDEFDDMERQAHIIASWGENVYVKIPVTNTRREPTHNLLLRLAKQGIKVNVTALMTLQQVRSAAEALGDGPPAYISVFAGRIADTGRDPVPIMSEALEIMRPYPNLELLWASPRELLNIFQAEAIGCHIITATTDILKKLELIGKDLDEFSLETVQMFYRDAQAAGYQI
jgi:transaldolase